MFCPVHNPFPQGGYCPVHNPYPQSHGGDFGGGYGGGIGGGIGGYSPYPQSYGGGYGGYGGGYGGRYDPWSQPYGGYSQAHQPPRNGAVWTPPDYEGIGGRFDYGKISGYPSDNGPYFYDRYPW
ncbi:hypothetical protein PG985_001417 [Apiospora marii]|uniref:uncharacterized protein n=1 Tax=Apiospora marii TaxID=335849 RepID=UPI00313280C0